MLKSSYFTWLTEHDEDLWMFIFSTHHKRFSSMCMTYFQWIYFARCDSYLFRFANPVKRERHHMGAVENISVSATTGDRGDFASVETDGHLVGDLWLWWCGGFSYRATEVKPCKDTKKRRGEWVSTFSVMKCFHCFKELTQVLYCFPR